MRVIFSALALVLAISGPASAQSVSVDQDPSLARSRIFPPSAATSGVAIPSPAIDGIDPQLPSTKLSHSKLHKARHASTVARLKTRRKAG
jgi:hypothetical protein